jgi:phosphatidylserine decarboxylase
LYLPPIEVVDRASGRTVIERVYGEKIMSLLYGDSLSSKLFGPSLRIILRRVSFISAAYGWLQRRPRSRHKVGPFITKYGLNPKEFEKSIDQFTSFDDFFIRKLKPGARAIDPDPQVIVAPADGRYWCAPQIDQTDSFYVKGEKFCIDELLQDKALGHKFAGGTMVIARLCPSDYHRFHFPCSGRASSPRLINGLLGSVNPESLKLNIRTFVQNKRMITEIESEEVGHCLFIDVGATCVGTIHQTFQPNSQVKKGDEKGYFSFGGSSIILLFEPGRLVLDRDLIETSARFAELRCLMGQSIGRCIN